MVPVAGVLPAQVPDTFRSPRGARIYGALDLPAPRGTPVLSADAGRVLRLARGQVIGYVGTSGNADRRGPQLHFQVMVRPNDARWWGGQPIDPRPFFVTAGEAR